MSKPLATIRESSGNNVSGNIVIAGVAAKYANGLTDQQALDLLGQDVQPELRTRSGEATKP